MGLREFSEKRNRILIIRSVGGLGDIFMHRMMFEDFKRLMPEAEIHFACPSAYHAALKDHPFIDKLLGMEGLNRLDYNVSYNTTTACGRTEMKLAPYSGPHRSDIWSNHCGVILTKHNMHIRLSEEEINEGKRLIESNRNREGPCVVISPISAMKNKNLQDRQLGELVKKLHEMGCFVVGLHTTPIGVMDQNNAPVLNDLNLRQWLSVIQESDYVISVDSAAFHAAGGMGKPVLGVFSFINGGVYSQYYPKASVVQGRCPYGYGGCYDWGLCPDKGALKPCLTNITSEMILDGVNNMMRKWPLDETKHT